MRQQPIEDKVVSISRAQGSLTFPANLMLVAAMNPCPCGWRGDAPKQCTCSESTVTKYQKQISGPLLDRIDIHIEVPRVDYQKLSGDRLGESSETIRCRVQSARDIQCQRFATIESSNLQANADMRAAEIRQFCKWDEAGETLIRAATGQRRIIAGSPPRLRKKAESD